MSKLGKFAAAWAAVVLSVSAFGEDPIALTAAFEGSEDPACVYLKADAAGTGTGRSWANACTNVAEAIDRGSYAATVSGLERIPDAFGQKRASKSCSIGPVERRLGLTLFVR